MDGKEFKRLMMKIKLIYGNHCTLTADDMNNWFMVFKDFNAYRLEKAFDEYSKSNPYMPVPADLIVLYNKISADRNAKIKEWQDEFLSIVNLYPAEYVDENAFATFKKVAVTTAEDIDGSIRKSRIIKKQVENYVNECDRKKRDFKTLSSVLFECERETL